MFFVNMKGFNPRGTAMKFTTPRRTPEKAEIKPTNPLWIITAMLAIFAAAAAAIVAFG